MTEGLIGVALRILSRVTSGAGATIGAFTVGSERVFACETSGAGATTLAVKLSDLRVNAEFNSGVGGSTRGVGNAGANRDERNPSDGGGPGIGLNARRLATDESERGKFNFGASTTCSDGLEPRATRMV
jgi:hypothetical protein